mgnify:CR=1 FL=1
MHKKSSRATRECNSFVPVSLRSKVDHALRETKNAGLRVRAEVDLSRFSAAPGSHLSGDPFKSQGTFPA